MKICLHSNQFDGRGTGRVPYDYGVALRDILGHEVVFLTSALSQNEGLTRIREDFEVILYPEMADVSPPSRVRFELERAVDQHRIDFMHMIKYGTDDQVTPRNCRSGIHYVFNGSEPHGSVYAAVSANLARKYGRREYVPHIVQALQPTKDVRKMLGIPEHALVIGRHGGFDTFDLGFVHEAVRAALAQRNDIYFLFLSTRRFVEHERVIHFDWVPGTQGVYNFIHACDMMLHARQMGETFGLSVAEFSACDKPVLTWRGTGHPGYDTAHIEQLCGKAIQYQNHVDLLRVLLNIQRSDLPGHGWDTFTDVYTPRNVIQQFEQVFLADEAVQAPAARGLELAGA